MAYPHLINISLHVLAGVIALGCGALILFRAKGTSTHRRIGRIFGYSTLLVCLFAATGLSLFRFLPVFAVLTVLVAYQLVGGWRAAYTQARGPSALDAGWTLLAAVAAIALVPVLFAKPPDALHVVYGALGGLASILLYDCIKWLFPRSWHRSLWRYEHSYKMLGSLFGMLSALIGNVVRVGQPWSQLAPLIVGTLVIAYFFREIYRAPQTELSEAS